MTKPSAAKRIAAPATSAKLMLPYRLSAVIQASGAAGTTMRRMLSGISPSCSRWKRSGDNAFGQTPRPLMVTTSRVSAR